MRIRMVFGALTLGTLTLAAMTVWPNSSGSVPGPFAGFIPNTRLGPAEAAGPAPGVAMAARPAPPLLRPAPVDVSVEGFYSWALLDRRTGKISGSANSATTTNSTESMIKVWIAADYLRRLGDAEPNQDRLDELSRMIRDSNDSAAEDVYELDGADAVVERMINVCGLTKTSGSEGWWSRTEVSARDAVLLGACVTDGRAAGPKWTSWILSEMRQVRGEGRFGIIDALPATAVTRIPIKNGWTVVGDEWHVNCLAVVDQYVLAVLTRYPESLGLSYGAGICRSVTAQLRPRT